MAVLDDRRVRVAGPLLLLALSCGDSGGGDAIFSEGGSGGSSAAGGPGAGRAGSAQGGSSAGSTMTGGTAGSRPVAGSGGSMGGSSGSKGGSGGSGTVAGSGGLAGGSGGSGGGNDPNVILSCTRSLPAGASLSDLQSAVNSAKGGDVLCVPRGSTFQGTLSVNNQAPTAASRVTVCAKDPSGDECSREGGANPRISGRGSGITFSKTSDGFVFRDFDVVCTSGCGDGAGVNFGGANQIRFEGGLVSGWGQAFMCNSFEFSTPCDGIEIGARGNVTRVHDNQNGFFGWLSNSFVRIDARNNGDGSVFMHHFYLSSGPRNAPSTNVVFEHGYYTQSSVSNGSSLGTFLNLSGQNRDIVIRNNVFEDTRCSTYVVDCSSGGEDPQEFCDGVEIYGNTFKTDCPLILNLESTQRARIYNNVFVGGGQVLSLTDAERPAADGWFFNNTVYCTANCETFFSLSGNDNRFFNNLIHAGAGSNIVGGGSSACARFGGSNGPNFTNNFLYAPRSSPRFPNCGTGNSSDTNVLPGFAAPEQGDFHLTSNSPAAGFGTPKDAPASDFDGKPRASPPSAGAFEAP